MSQPTPYTPTTDFSQQEANNASGRSTVNTAALDAEFAAIDTTLDQTLANIQLLQRDDGRLMDVSVEIHTLSPEVLNLMGGFNLRGAWLSNTDYLVNDLVSSGSYTYVCQVAHNSGPTFSETNWLKFGFAGSNDAAQAAAAAAVSANEAHISELAAAASASAASSSASSASTSASTATTKSSEASASAGSASTSATNASNSASDAAASAASISVPGGKAIVLKDSAGVSYVEGAAGTTAQRPVSPVVGYTRFNTTIGADETWGGGSWLVAGNVTQTGIETLTNKTIALGSNTVSGTLAQFNTACSDADFASLAALNASGRVVGVKHYADGGGSTSYGGGMTSAQQSYFNYTPKSTNSTLIVIYTAYEQMPVIAGNNYYHNYDVFESPGNSRVGTLSSQVSNSSGGLGELSQIACSFSTSNTSLATRSFYMVHQTSNGAAAVALTAIHATIFEVLN